MDRICEYMDKITKKGHAWIKWIKLIKWMEYVDIWNI